MSFSIDKYRFYHSKNKVVAVSTYAGKPVRGVAKCDPCDAFSLEDGKSIAAARCNEKIAEKRLSRARRKLIEAQHEFFTSQRYYERMKEYFNDAEMGLVEAHNNVVRTLAKFAP